LDGVLDVDDKCPLEPEDPDGYQDEDGCPDLDNDGDTVPDLKDQCPNTIGDTDKEPLGCPSNALVVVTDCEVKITQQIHFEYNKATIRKISHNVLDAVVEVLDKNSDIKIQVQGHTDNRGSAAYNMTLSDRRAGAVMKYLVSHGVDAHRLTSRGYGFDRPLVPNTSDENRALNRRVQFVRTEGTKEGCPKTGSD
jgi:outer membrane protein OmpA-like peptidoglycan-associated protein